MKENENKEPSSTAGAAKGGNTNTEIIGSAVSTAVGEPVATAQKDFEDWAFEDVGLNTAKDVDGSYESPETWKAWRAWQEATVRASTSRLAAPTQAKLVDLSGLRQYHYNEFSKNIHADPCGEYFLVADIERLFAAPTQVSTPQASAAQEVRAVPVGHARQSELDKLVDGRVAGVGMMIHKEPGEGKVALYLAPVSTSTAPAAMDEAKFDDVAALWWDAAKGEAAMYVAAHCVDGEVHAEHIMEQKRPKFGSQPSLDEVTGAGKGEAK